jgi:hypothetical protein
LRERLDAAGLTEGALFRQMPKGGKRIGGRLGGRAYSTSSRTALPGLASTRGSTAAIQCDFAVDFDCGTQRRIGWNMNEISRHKSTDVLASYVREAELVRAARIGRDVLKREWARR